MRDERGEMIQNAHLLGFFRRIVRLLCNRIRPVFVFDGDTPVLKRQTVAARRRQRAQADVKLKRVAEKLLLNNVRAHMQVRPQAASQRCARTQTLNLWACSLVCRAPQAGRPLARAPEQQAAVRMAVRARAAPRP